jgi:aldehyde:ferredoxin oxidoreductase
MIKAVTGWDTGMVEMLKVAERTLTLLRMFNLREGIGETEDRLPERYFQAHQGGPVAGKNYSQRKGNLEKARKYYYSVMGWDQHGVPTPETLEALDIAWAAKA